MGDYADDAIDAGFAEWGGYDGDDDDDAFYEGDGGFGGYVTPARRRPNAVATCKFCGETGLRWGDHNGRRRQFNVRGELHHCLKPTTAAPKPDLETEILKARAACKAAVAACDAALALMGSKFK